MRNRLRVIRVNLLRFFRIIVIPYLWVSEDLMASILSEMSVLLLKILY